MFEALCSSRGQRLLRKLEQPERDISIGLIASFCIASVEERNAAGYRLLNGLQGLHVRLRSGSREVFFATGWTAPSKLGESAMQLRGAPTAAPVPGIAGSGRSAQKSCDADE